jgi:transcriptional regulator CtsR
VAFYLRKAFKAGPVRLNLSKGGIGLSAGITGARIGLSPRGAYVHGGRHGLYYRKYMKSGKRTKSSGSKSHSNSYTSNTHGSTYTTEGTVPELSNAVSLFRDTGVTFRGQSADMRTITREEPSQPPSLILTKPIQLALGITAILFFISVLNTSGWMVLFPLILMVGLLGWVIWHGLWQQKIKKSLLAIAENVEKTHQFVPSKILPGDTMPNRWKMYYHFQLHAIVGEMAMRQEHIHTQSTLQALDEFVPLKNEVAGEIRASILSDIIDEMLEDHLLSMQEEQVIQQMLNQLNLPESLVTRELERIQHFSRIRNEMERHLVEINPGIPMVRGEVAFEVYDHVRLLNERVQRIFQRDNVQYREVGYEIASEGKCILTDRRMIIIHRGSQEYRLNRIVDITADPEAGIVELALSNRKSPLILTMDEPLLFAARLEKILNEKLK